MKRVYRLLRDNLESGPYSIDELLGQQLMPTDMLWIDGRSTAWCYISEIELFPSAEPGMSNTTAASSNKDDIETRAEDIRKKILGFKKQELPVREEKGVQGEKHYFIPVTPVDTIEMVDHRKKKSSMPSDVLMTLLIIGLFAGGLYGGRSLFLPKKQFSQPSQVIQSVSKDEHAAKTIIPEKNEPLVTAPAVDSSLLAVQLNPGMTAKSSASSRASKKITRISIHHGDSNTVASKTENQSGDINDDQSVKTEGEAVKEIKPVVITGDDVAKADASEKKQGLFKKIFGKKKKNEDANN